MHDLDKTANHPDITIVIPVYNAVDHLADSLESALGQTHQNIEIICVNDASQDDSLDILNEFSKNNSRIKVIDLENNRGASSARNMGIEHAVGNHLFFLDADDTLPLDALENLLAASNNPECDLVMGELSWFRSEQEVNTKLANNDESQNMKITEVRESQFLQSVPGCHCCNLYSRVFLDLHGIRYASDLTYGEDQLFQATAIVKARKVSIIDKIVYFYHHYRSTSLTRKPPTLKNLLDDVEYQRRMVDLFFSAGLFAAGARFLNNWSYPISEYWTKIPQSISEKESVILFSEFRKLITEYNAKPWNESTPAHHRHLLGLVFDGHDQRAYEFLATDEARYGF